MSIEYPYSEDKAFEEASKMKEKIDSGEAKSYNEAEKLMDQNKMEGKTENEKVITKAEIDDAVNFARSQYEEGLIDEKELNNILRVHHDLNDPSLKGKIMPQKDADLIEKWVNKNIIEKTEKKRKADTRRFLREKFGPEILNEIEGYSREIDMAIKSHVANAKNPEEAKKLVNLWGDFVENLFVRIVDGRYRNNPRQGREKVEAILKVANAFLLTEYGTGRRRRRGETPELTQQEEDEVKKIIDSIK
jgi:hypothetical protein